MFKNDSERLNYLIGRYFDEALTEKEVLELNTYIDEPAYTDEIESMLPNAFDTDMEIPALGLDELQKRAILSAIFEQTTERPKVIRLWPRIAVAASILMVLSVGIYVWLNHDKAAQQVAQNTEQLYPAKKGVILRLANGQQVNLASIQQGLTHTADGTQIKNEGNHIDYQEKQQTKAEWHTLINNSAQKYIVILNDGTEVDLDITSSITYPTQFSGKERKVMVTGQTYFKVKHNAQSPFRVQVGKVAIEDIGTEFNIDAYDPAIKTTLVQGAARVTLADKHVLLKPGKQAFADEAKIMVEDADLESVTSWLQGDFVFNHELLENILTTVERIYDVHFIWQDKSLRKLKFNGLVSRSKKLATVLNYIRKTGPVDFVAEGKNIKVFRKH
jgi:hypothetical protein